MEPSALNSSDEDELRLKALLRDAVPELPDDGFSARVVASLPTRATVGVKSYRGWFVMAGLVAGLTVAWSQFSAEQNPTLAADGLMTTMTEFANALAPLADPALATGTLIAIACCAFALWSGRDTEHRT